MKLDLLAGFGGGGALRAAPRPFAVSGETDRLTDVLLCPPSHLAPVPCCSVTRESLRAGFSVSTGAALAQHRALARSLIGAGVRVHMLPARPDLPDLCFTRDSAVMSPWGLIVLNPAAPHRRAEADHLARWATAEGIAIAHRVRVGTAEGGDICVARPGLLIVGTSGERTCTTGVGAVAAPFRAQGWRVIVCPFDSHFLHLDTQFCMLDERTALACVDVLDDRFLQAVAAEGIELVPVSYKDGRRLGANILALGNRRILASDATPAVAQALRRRGFDVETLDIAQFARCGGGLHCLTMPLGRG